MRPIRTALALTALAVSFATVTVNAQKTAGPDAQLMACTAEGRVYPNLPANARSVVSPVELRSRTFTAIEGCAESGRRLAIDADGNARWNGEFVSVRQIEGHLTRQMQRDSDDIVRLAAYSYTAIDGEHYVIVEKGFDPDRPKATRLTVWEEIDRTEK